MKRNTVAVAGIAGVVILMTIGLFTGHDGALLASSMSVIGALVGYTFGKLEDGSSPPAKSKYLAVLLAAGLLLGGCAGTTVGVEACIVDPEYGRICASYQDGKVTIKADGQIPQELRDKIESYMRKLGGKE